MASSLGIYRQPSLTSDPVEVDPANRGTIVRVALGVEALLNVPMAPLVLLYPAKFLSLVASDTSQITPLAEMATRFYGTMMVGLTLPIIYGAFNSRGAIESRPTTYLTLGGVEAGFLATALWVICGPRAASGFAPDIAWSIVKQIGPAFLWHMFVLHTKPQWFGRYREAKRCL
ncbi:hypothetical protein BU16DRAFT_532237 [Lophium mytilinum]|uniref:Uncharacterized protein n=1 Tax=Lophium mytilinum TaxID=390894 RepID=A0A6A6QAI5_9PEZI|nr:hypothetical protein BU16DRAFT_532237 [Lophium mytilinum]